MTEPLVFQSRSSRYALPLLFAGQAQKEFFINEALCRTDSLLHPAIEGEQDTPPTPPQEGQSWLIGATPNDEWTGKAGQLACYQAGSWVYTVPRDGLRLLDRSSGQYISYLGEWKRPDAPPPPTDGSVIDIEAREALNAVIASLVDAGILRTA